MTIHENCYTCTHSIILKKPEHCRNPKFDYIVHGHCNKDKGVRQYPIYVPTGKCNEYQKDISKTVPKPNVQEEQISMF